MSQTPYDANTVLMNGGAGNPAWKFDTPNPGQPRTGTITEPPQTRQERDYDPKNPGGGDPKFFPSGDPIMGVLVTVQTEERDPVNYTDDDGKRTFYIEGRYLKEAVRSAVQAAGARGLEVGGQIHVEFTHREDPMDKRSRKFWKIAYTPAGNAALMGEAGPAPAQEAPAAPPAQQTPPAPIPAAPAPGAAGAGAGVPAAAVPAAGGKSPAELAQQLIGVGLDDAGVAAATGLDATVVAALRANAA